jgi:hypothetical protein
MAARGGPQEAGPWARSWETSGEHAGSHGSGPPSGAVVGRPASSVRAGEERWLARSLADLGIPILRTVGGHGTFEGADALWLTPERVLVGLGIRTNLEGARRLAATLAEQGIETMEVDLPHASMHLIGEIRIVDRDLAFVRRGRCPWRAVQALTEAELATMCPRAGGTYVYLREAYGPGVAFVFGWTRLLLIQPAFRAIWSGGACPHELPRWNGRKANRRGGMGASGRLDGPGRVPSGRVGPQGTSVAVSCGRPRPSSPGACRSDPGRPAGRKPPGQG